MVAFDRGTSNRWAVLVVDVFLGWTGIAWVVALVMAASGAGVARKTVLAAPNPAELGTGGGYCRGCGHPIPAGMGTCYTCGLAR